MKTRGTNNVTSRARPKSLTTLVFPILILLLLNLSLSAADSDSYRGPKKLTGVDVVKTYQENEYGIPMFVDGVLSAPVAPGRHVEAVLNYFDANKSVYRMSSPADELEVMRTETDELGMHHIRFQQMYQGLRVINRELIAHFSPEAFLKTVNGNFEPDINLETTAGIDAAEAIRVATADLLGSFGEGTPDEPELVVFPWMGTDYLCWRLFMRSENPPGRWEYFIEAGTGDVVYKANRIIYDTDANDIGNGTGVMGDARNHIDTDDNGTSFDMIDRTRRAGNNPHGHNGQMPATRDLRTRDADGIALPGILATDADNVWSGSDEQRACVDGHVYSAMVYDWMLTQYGRNGYDGAGASMLTIVNYTHPWSGSNNAYWDGSRIVVWSWTAGWRSLAGCADVIAHEWGHAITENESNLIYEREPGALNESFSDMMGAAFEFANPDVGGSDWEMGENGRTSGVPFRDMEDPPARGDPDYYGNSHANWVNVVGCIPSSGNDQCGVHTNSGVGNKWFSLLSDGGTHHSVTVTGITVSNAIDVAYRANRFYWTSNDNYYQAALATVTAADDLNAAGTWSQQVINAWTAVGVFSGGALILVDRTGSMGSMTGSETRFQKAIRLAKTDVAGIFQRNPNAQVAVMAFDEPPAGADIVLMIDFSNSESDVTDAIDLIGPPRGLTPLAQAMGEAADHLFAAAPQGYRHLHVYTDGGENSSTHDASWTVTGVCNSDLTNPPNVLGGDWDPVCDPLDAGNFNCEAYQLCMATQLISNSIVNVRYYGDPITKDGSPPIVDPDDPEREDIALTALADTDPPQSRSTADFRFFRALTQQTGGNFGYESDTNLRPVALCRDVTVSADQDCLGHAWIDNGSYDPDGDPINIRMEPTGPFGPGQWQVDLIVYELGVGLADTCQGLVTVIDYMAPTCYPPNDTTIFLCVPTEICLPVGCEDNCDPNPEMDVIQGPGTIVGDHWCYTPPGNGTFVVTVRCTDSTGNYCDSEFRVTIWMAELAIEKTHNTIQGQFVDVAITMVGLDLRMGGFDVLVAYDASALGLQSAIPGPAFYDPAPDGCGWEYFTYRFGPFGNCGDACPSGMVRIFGLAETNNGPNHPSCYGVPDSDPHELAGLKFLVTNDRTFECQYAPIGFFWGDCGDNTISNQDGSVLYMDRVIHDYDGRLIWHEEDDDEFPEDERIPYVGAPDYCLNPDPNKPSPFRLICFVNGGVDIVCADSIDDRGDINLNGVVNEVADAVLFSNYFVHGISVFNVNIDGQIAASDVNADGITLSVADLVYMIRIITGDALPYPKLTAMTANADLVNGVLSVNGDMGAAYVVVERSITPQLLAESMEMKYQYDADHDLTRILVYSMDKDRRFAGDFLGGIDGNVITLEMATYEGAPVTTKLVPDEFALYPSYPNPFNPITTISFALAAPVDFQLVIYNSLGQTVETFSGHSGPGLERIDWNASGFASGVYFYRLTAGDFTDTKKMVLLK